MRRLNSACRFTALAAVIAGGCQSSGPYCAMSGAISPEDGAPEVIVKQYYVRESILPGYRSASDSVAFAVPARLDGQTWVPAGPAVTIGGSRLVGVDPDYVAYRSFRPIAGDPQHWLWIEPTSGHLFGPSETIDVSVVDVHTGERRRVTSVPSAERQWMKGSFAATRDGRHVLVIGGDEATLWDVESGRGERRPSLGVLCRLARVERDRRKVPGDWFLTDDLHYVVNVLQAAYPDGDGGNSPSYDPGPLSVGDVTFVPDTDAVALDLTTGSWTKVAAATGSGREYDRLGLADAESVNGQLQLLYIARPWATSFKPKAVVTTADGRQIAAADPAMLPSDEFRPVRWDPASDQLTFESFAAAPVPQQASDRPSERPEGASGSQVWPVHIWCYPGAGPVSSYFLDAQRFAQAVGQ